MRQNQEEKDCKLKEPDRPYVCPKKQDCNLQSSFVNKPAGICPACQFLAPKKKKLENGKCLK